MTSRLLATAFAAMVVAGSTATIRAEEAGHARANLQPHYPQLSAAMNPVPRPNIPWQVGGTMYTNQAFYAHEMLYPHCYKAMYGPYYWTVRGKWKITPRGVRECQDWQLRGTEVKVNYRSSYAPFSLFKPPSIR